MKGSKSQAINAQDISYEIEGKTLLDGVTLQADRGQLVGLIGPNGAGKSTLLRTISGILKHRGGSVRLEGADLKSLSSKDVAAALALVPQIAPYTHGFTSIELVLMGRYPHLGRFQIEGKEDDRIARDAMRLTETEEFADRTLRDLVRGRAPAGIRRSGLGSTTSHPSDGRAYGKPGCPPPTQGARPCSASRQRRIDGRRSHPRPEHGGALLRPPSVAERRAGTRGRERPRKYCLPETIESAFGVTSAVHRDPITGALAISLIGPANERPLNGERIGSNVA